MLKFLYDIATDKRRGLIPGIIKAFLFILSLVYGLIIRAAIFFNRISLCSFSCKVISVGNITLGGTGKTTVVEYIARYLKSKGRKIAVISRGYKRASACRSARVSECRSMGDEPYMLSKKLEGIPVIVDADRIRGIKKAIKDFGVDTVILDDAFQQWRINKDLEIVTIDAADPFGNRHMLPRGILREPLCALKRADIFMLTKANLHPDTESAKATLKSINPSAGIFESYHLPAGFYDIEEPARPLPADSLKGKSAGVFCGIGDPASFEDLIESLGVHIARTFRFTDHHNYSPKDLEKIIKSCKEMNIDTIITTEKDAVRISGVRLEGRGWKFLVLKIELGLKDEQGFSDRLLKLYSL